MMLVVDLPGEVRQQDHPAAVGLDGLGFGQLGGAVVAALDPDVGS